MSKLLVYLAGPITGQSYGGCTSWREGAKQSLSDMSDGRIEGLSPMRFKRYLVNELTIGDSYEDFALSSQRGIFSRDKFDCRRSDMILVNMLGATEKSTGSIMEIAWADAFQNPIVLVMEASGNPHDHAMLREACAFRVPTLEEGLSIVTRVLLA